MQRKKCFLIAVLFFLLTGFLASFQPTKAASGTRFATYSGQSTQIGGYISENTTWTVAGSPYIVVENLTVEPNVFLTIEPGVVVKFCKGTNLAIDGALAAKGNYTHKITFTSNATTPSVGDWEKIWIKRGSIDSSTLISNVIIEYADIGIHVQDASPILSDIIVSDNKQGILFDQYFDVMHVRISNAVISNNTYGLYSLWTYNLTLFNSTISNNTIGIYGRANLRIINCSIMNNAGIGVQITHATTFGLEISRSIVSHNGDAGIWVHMSGGYGERIEVHENSIFDNAAYNLENSGPVDINATYNWWGSTNETLIEELIYDYYDDSNFGKVLYRPCLVAPIESYPVVSFFYGPSEPVVNETVTFDASNSYDSDGSIASYYWDFGDDTNAIETEPITNHTYAIAGTYTVTLNVTDNDGLTSIVPARDVISVGKLNSTISISASPTTLMTGEYTTINGTVTPTREGAKVTIWYRYLGEDAWLNLTAIAADESSIYSYDWTPSKPGTYELKTSWLGDENTFRAESSTINVTRLSPPVPSFTYSPAIPLVGTEMTFDASSSYDVDEDIASYRWDFDDGNTSSTVTPTILHTYVFGGTYSVTLTVIDASGLNSSISRSVSVKMLTSVSVLTSSQSTFVGFKVNITGTLCDIYGNPLRNETVVLSYTFSGIGTRIPITSDATDNLGNYFAMWVPPATGYFEIIAEWAGNSTHFGTSNTIAVSTIPYENQYVFTVESNSTISDLTFDQKSGKLSFDVSGENGTTGYTRVTIAKSLIMDVTKIKIRLDGLEYNYTVSELNDSWVLLFTYNHSLHQVEVDLQAAIPEFPSFLMMALFMIGTALAVIAYKKRRSENRVFTSLRIL